MANELINYRQLSTILTGKPGLIRVDRESKKHKEAIQELNNFLEFWQNKYKK